MKTLLLVLALISTPLLRAEEKPAETVALEPQKVFKLVAKKGHETRTSTAFFVAPNQLLTANHAVKDMAELWLEKDGRSVAVRVVKCDGKADIALLECEEVNTYYQIESLKVIGFPKGGALSASVATASDEKLRLKADSTPGMSGGPVVNASGEVVGMIVQHGSGNNYSVCKAIPASTLEKFLKN